MMTSRTRGTARESSVTQTRMPSKREISRSGRSTRSTRRARNAGLESDRMDAVTMKPSSRFQPLFR